MNVLNLVIDRHAYIQHGNRLGLSFQCAMYTKERNNRRIKSGMLVLVVLQPGHLVLPLLLKGVLVTSPAPTTLYSAAGRGGRRTGTGRAGGRRRRGDRREDRVEGRRRRMDSGGIEGRGRGGGGGERKDVFASRHGYPELERIQL